MKVLKNLDTNENNFYQYYCVNNAILNGYVPKTDYKPLIERLKEVFPNKINQIIDLEKEICVEEKNSSKSVESYLYMEIVNEVFPLLNEVFD